MRRPRPRSRSPLFSRIPFRSLQTTSRGDSALFLLRVAREPFFCVALKSELPQGFLAPLGRPEQIDGVRASVDWRSIPAVGVEKRGACHRSESRRSRRSGLRPPVVNRRGTGSPPMGRTGLSGTRYEAWKSPHEASRSPEWILIRVSRPSVKWIECSTESDRVWDSHTPLPPYAAPSPTCSLCSPATASSARRRQAMPSSTSSSVIVSGVRKRTVRCPQPSTMAPSS